MMTQPQTLAAHCTALLCHHLPEVLEQAANVLPLLPRPSKAALLAVARRAACSACDAAAAAECDRVVLALADAASTSLDVSGLPLTDAAAGLLAPRCGRLRALDVRRCPLLTAAGLRALLAATPELRVLRCGGCVQSDRAARNALPALLPRLRRRDAVASTWEAADATAAACAAPALQWLVWPEADADSAARLARGCPRITLLRGRPLQAPAACVEAHAASRTPPDAVAPAFAVTSSLAMCSTAAPIARMGATSSDSPSAPPEADLLVALDAPALTALWPLLNMTATPAAAAAAAASFVPPASRPAQVHIAELFRRAYEARDLRLAPKRAKNARQRQRRHAARAGCSSAEGALARCGGALRAGGAAALRRADLLPIDMLRVADC